MTASQAVVVVIKVGDKLLLESEVMGFPPYQVGDEIELILRYRRGIARHNLQPVRYQVLALKHQIRRVEQPHQAMYYQFYLLVSVEQLQEKE